MTKRAGSPITASPSESPRPKKARIGDLIVDRNFRPATVADAVEDGAEEEKVEQEEVGRKEGDESEDEEDGMEVEEEVGGEKGWGRDGPPEEYSDLYLDTINRKLLDFDFEKLCSVSLANINVYACLVCGKYFQGRGKSSHAYFHSVDQDHHVYINMSTLKVYILPEGYEVKNKTLEDIKFVVNPTYTKEDVARLDRGAEKGEAKWDLLGRKYVPGFVGLNNIKQNDYLNVIVHALAHVPPLRNFLLLSKLPDSAPQILQRFSILVRKIWNPRAFKAHVSPHELLQEVSRRSNKRFTLTTQADPVEFLTWFLNTLHLSLGGSPRKPQSSLIQRIFQGTIQTQSQTILKHETASRLIFSASEKIQTQNMPFLTLSLDLPPVPLFTDPNESGRTIIPQVSLYSLLSKFDGQTAHELRGERKRYLILDPPPPYLILKVNRFTRNKFVQEKNPTIVTFPTEGLDLAPYVRKLENPDNAKDGSLDTVPVQGPIYYDLVANVVHESITGKRAPGQRGQQSSTAAATVGTAGTGAVSGEEEERHVWKCQVRRGGSGGDWVEIQDLWVEEVRKEILFLGETCLQVWERRRK